MTSDIRAVLASYENKTNEALRRLTDLLLAPKDASYGGKLDQAMRYSLLGGGKRIRPALCYISARSLGGETDVSDYFAAALECMHAYSLIHDDLPAMDDDKLRRGQATCHIAFDEATAILAGDALQALAFELISMAPGADAGKVEACSILAKASGARGMVLGQAIDLASDNSSIHSTEQLEAMHQLKTGALIEASVLLGAISANASDEVKTALSAYAKHIGLAFQIQDDILDVTSDTETLGKTVGSDQQQNKLTYVSLLGLETAQKKAQWHLSSAIAAIDAWDDEGLLALLARYIVERKH